MKQEFRRKEVCEAGLGLEDVWVVGAFRVVSQVDKDVLFKGQRCALRDRGISVSGGNLYQLTP